MKDVGRLRPFSPRWNHAADSSPPEIGPPFRFFAAFFFDAFGAAACFSAGGADGEESLPASGGEPDGLRDDLAFGVAAGAGAPADFAALFFGRAVPDAAPAAFFDAVREPRDFFSVGAAEVDRFAVTTPFLAAGRPAEGFEAAFRVAAGLETFPFFAADFFPAGFFVEGFFVVDGFRAADFLAAGFFAAARFGAAFFAEVFAARAVAFLADFFATDFFAADFFVAGFFEPPAFFAEERLAAAALRPRLVGDAVPEAFPLRAVFDFAAPFLGAELPLFLDFTVFPA